MTMEASSQGDAIPPPERPRLRRVEAHPVQMHEAPMVALRDPSAVDDARTIVLSHAALALISLFDGRRDVGEVQGEYLRRHGERVGRDVIADVVAKLDRALLLHSPRYAAELDRRRALFRALPYRPMTLAGSCFPADEAGAAALLRSFFKASQGPGRLPDPGAGPTVSGVLSPHIDYERGAALYAQAFLPVIEGAADAELFVILGTDHRGEVDAAYSLTGLDFETPFGRLQTDQALVEELCREDPGLRAGELGHQLEHSIEFQAVMLHYLLGNRASRARILPVLCGGMDSLADTEAAVLTEECAERQERSEAFIRRLVSLRESRRTCFIAGADLAHLGPAFSTAPLDEAAHERLREADEVTLGWVAGAAPEAFRQDVMADENARNICGLSAIYTLLRVLSGAPGEILAYRQCPVPGEDDGGSRVSIAAVRFGAAVGEASDIVASR